MDCYDLLVVGGGINGTAIARDAAVRGASVLLVERDDLGQHTSSASSKLIHGGLRYLEMFDFRLVAEALAERERLVAMAPHLVRPVRFVLPHAHSVRPWWLIRLGLMLYDRLGGRSRLPRSRGLRRSDAAYQAPLARVSRGFVYSDAVVDDARLVVANALDAAAQGATIRTRTALVSAQRRDGRWVALLSDGTRVGARAIVNAAGPWVAQVLGQAGGRSAARVRLVKGSHIVVPRLYAGDHAYMLQQPDRRVVFAFPWGGGTAIGTTDFPVDRPEDAKIDTAEIAYLCAAANRYFAHAVAPGDVVASWSGVRPLHDDGADEARAVTRDHVLELDAADGAPLLSVFGGKITTARHVAEEAVGRLTLALGLPAGPVTRERRFPGGDIGDAHAFAAAVAARWPFLGAERAARMAYAYGSVLETMLAGVDGEAGLGEAFGAGLTALEARWLRAREWATAPDDILWRRTRLGHAMTPGERARFAAWWRQDAAGLHGGGQPPNVPATGNIRR